MKRNRLLIFYKAIIFTFLITFSNIVFGQLNGEISIGYNRYTNNYKDYERTNGIALQFALDKKLTEYLSMSIGLGGKIACEYYYGYYYEFYNDNGIIKGRFVTGKDKAYSVNWFLPLNIITQITKKIHLTSGISLNLDNSIIWFDSSTKFEIPESGISEPVSIPYEYSWPITNAFGYGYQLGLIYSITPKVKLSGELKNTKNSDFSFHYFEIGIKYQIITNR